MSVKLKGKKNGGIRPHNQSHEYLDTRKEFERITNIRSWLYKMYDEKNAQAKTTELIRSKPARPLPDSVTDLRIAGIFDPFTEACIGADCTIVNLGINTWKEQVEDFEPDLLLLESAWRGRNDEWKHKISQPSGEIQELITFCKSRSIPVVFWNKEDPEHYNIFLATARSCDYIFTTDIDCVGRYKSDLNKTNVFLLPFAAAPGIHNPIEKYQRKDKIVFAGSYYQNRYEERKEEFDALLNICASTIGIDIYDRNLNAPGNPFPFPDMYQQYIVGSLPYEEIDRAYKGYKFGLNMNSVKSSQTMFARRVYEQLASNCVTLSSYSRAVQNVFGDIVPCTNSPEKMKRLVQSLIDDPVRYQKIRLLGLRKVYTEHLYRHRIAYIMSIVFNKKYACDLPSILIISDPKTSAQLDLVIKHFKNQTHSRKRLLLVLDTNVLSYDSSDSSIKVVRRNDFESLDQKQLLNADYVGYFSPGDYYGRNYLLDLALATLYCKAEVIGKAAQYQHESGTFAVSSDGKQYQYVDALDASSSIIAAACIQRDDEGRFIHKLISSSHRSGTMFSIDEMNYCKGWVGETCPQVDDPVLDYYGIPVAKMYEKAEMIKIMKPRQKEGETLVINDFRNVFRPSDNESVVVDSKREFTIRSHLPEGTWTHLRFKKKYKLSELSHSDRLSIHLDVKTEGKIGVFLAVLCFNDKDEKIGKLTYMPGSRKESKVPKGTTTIWPWLRVANIGKAEVKSITITGRGINHYTWLGRSSALLITNKYPSYDDLYQKFFIHARVAEYYKEGVPLDIYRFDKNKNEGYSEYEGVQVVTGYDEKLSEMLETKCFDTVLVHFLTPTIWDIIGKFVDRTKILVWIHSNDIQPWYRREYLIQSKEQLAKEKQKSEERIRFWRNIFSMNHPNLHFIFVSRTLVDQVAEDIGMLPSEDKYSIIHNFINTELFRYDKKTADMRKKILSIRPFKNAKYANDLTVKAILELSSRDFFKDLEIKIIGDGDLFEETVAPLAGLPDNVSLEKRFLPLDEMVEVHKHYGVFLVPTRGDLQGVSRDEAMSAGLVPVTNAVEAVIEFVDDSCAILAGPEDYMGLANGIERLYKNPELYLRMSRAARERTYGQCSKEHTINCEIELIRAPISSVVQRIDEKMSAGISQDPEPMTE